MTKETIEDYMPFIEAIRAGKTVQWTDYAHPDPDADWREIDGAITFIRPPQNYRIKPEPVMVPLGPEDVPPGSVVSLETSSGWVAIQIATSMGLCLPDRSLPWGTLLSEGWKIKRPGEDWKPCGKPAPES